MTSILKSLKIFLVILFRFRNWQALSSLPTTLQHKKILFLTTAGGHQSVLPLDLLMARGLRLLGHDARVALCWGGMPACFMCVFSSFDSIDEFERQGPSGMCQSCRTEGRVGARILSIPVVRLKKLPRSNSVERSVTTSENSRAGAIRFLASGKDTSEEFKRVHKVYMEGERDFLASFEAICASFSPDVAVIHHGVYVPQGSIAQMCRDKGIRIVTWSIGYRKNTFIFSHDDTYHKTMLKEDSAAWQDLQLDTTQKRRLTDYLGSREVGESDWMTFSKSTNDLHEFAGNLETTALLLTNVSWDAQVFYPGIAFPSMEAWIVETIKWFSRHPHLTLIVRVHPAEQTGLRPSRYPVSQLIREAFETLPDNVVVVDADSDVSTYKLMDLASVGLIFGSKVGVELTARGKTTIVAGEAWIKNKGLTLDPKSAEEYFGLLYEWSQSRALPAPDIELAQKYAYYFFFLRLISISSIEKVNESFAFKPKPLVTATDIDKDPGLKVVLDGILNQTPFLSPDNLR
jgi:hypothetical protein